MHFVYRCIDCGKECERDSVRYLCPLCGENFRPGMPLPGVLEAVFNYASIRKRLKAASEELWSELCAVERQFHPPYPVGNTPCFRAIRLGEILGYDSLFIKNDCLNPTGSLKDRASALMVAEANRLGEDTLVTASTGNAAVALSGVCAAAGKSAVIFVPEAAPPAKLIQILIHGARVIRVRGSYDDAFRLSINYTNHFGGLNRNTAYHPLTIEGKKTVAFEIFEQLPCVPDAILIPTGDGVILSAVYKGFYDLKEVGMISVIPRMIAVQSESSDAIHQFVQTGDYHNAASPSTIADSISVTAPSNAWMAAKAIRESNGTSITVSDDEIREAQKELAVTTGVFAEPAAAATLAGLAKGRSAGIKSTDRIVLLVTGHGLKNPESVRSRINIPDPIDATWEAVEAALSS